ncbi:uncharacterized protein [Littorina saxatilis]|uniref:Uncharacterized protein n=1 Tax=Littorina saxatilis TaxID=31220 RepID=A0AAN9BF10_9CAEN
MGCLNAKVDNDPRVGNGKAGGPNGTATTKTFSAGDPGGGGGGEAVDPRSPLDGRQIFKLKQSWKGIKRHMEDTGVEMFLR